MEVKKLHLEIIEEHDSLYILRISDSNTETRISFDTQVRTMEFLEEDELSGFLRSNEYQIRSLLYNKRSESYYKGFTLDFSIIDGKDMEAFNDRNNIIVKGMKMYLLYLKVKSQSLLRYIQMQALMKGFRRGRFVYLERQWMAAMSLR